MQNAIEHLGLYALFFDRILKNTYHRLPGRTRKYHQRPYL